VVVDRRSLPRPGHDDEWFSFPPLRLPADTNGLENFWSLLKRSLGGAYVSVRITFTAT
jgi:hypothetical protein